MPKRISQKTSHSKVKSKGQIKKKFENVGLFYKASFFVLLLSFIALFYFIVLVSTAPKSFPFITDKVQTYLQENIDENATIKNSYLSFTRYGTIKITLDELQFSHSFSTDKEREKIIIPKVESEITLYNILQMKILPSKIKIIDPKIVINRKKILSNRTLEDVTNVDEQKNAIITALALIRERAIPVKKFEIENAEILIKGKVIENRVLIKKSQIKSVFKGDVLHISSVNKFSFDKDRPDVNFSANCQIKNDNSLKCGASLVNFETSSIAEIHPKLKSLEQLDSAFNVTASLLVKAGILNNIIFKAQANKGSLDFPRFLAQKVDFSNLFVKGEYHNYLGILSLSDVKVDFHNVENINSPEVARLNMSMSVTNLKDPKNRQSSFDMRFQNVSGDEIGKFWPKHLNKGGVRDWVSEHVNGGIIKEANAKFTVKKEGEKNKIKKIHSKMVFSGLNLSYSKKFPKITNINGIAKFTIGDLKIAISDGDVLGSKIYDTKVTIEDLHSLPLMLNIIGKSRGEASDSLKHANNNKGFALMVEKYLNGDSQSEFDIRIPLSRKLHLKDAYVEVKSKIANLKNEYVKGAVLIAAKKDFTSSDFVTEFNFTNAKLHHKAFDIEKPLSQESGLDLRISFAQPGQIWLKDVLLWKRKSLDNKEDEVSKISAEVGLVISPLAISHLKIRNDNFGMNDYLIKYSTNKKKSSERLVVNGNMLNLGAFIKNKISFGSDKSKKSVLHSDYRVSVKNLLLANNKAVSDFSFSLDCDDGLCHSGYAIGNYNVKDLISLRINKNIDNANIAKNFEVSEKDKGNDFAKIKGTITNIGYLSEGLNFSDKISAAEVEVDLTNKILDGNQVVAGEVVTNGKITVFESAAVKRLAKDSLFSTIKDKIFSSEKIIFNSLKIDLSLSKGILKIKSLVANNYKIGITAKGEVNLRENSYDIRGMIVPGFILNNLFGIGKIPILGTVVSELLTGGKGGGLFGIHYEYVKKKEDKEPSFETNKVSAFVPTTIRKLFDGII